jgi:hypothetical protein
MGVNMAAWLGVGQAISSEERAALAWARIQDKPSSVAFRTPVGTTLGAQTVRLEVDNRAQVIASAAGAAPQMRLVVFGIRDHATLPDTDMAEGYRFVYGGDQYRIDDIILTIGEIQGVATATG